MEKGLDLEWPHIFHHLFNFNLHNRLLQISHLDLEYISESGSSHSIRQSKECQVQRSPCLGRAVISKVGLFAPIYHRKQPRCPPSRFPSLTHTHTSRA